jgi:hypothetical protein
MISSAAAAQLARNRQTAFDIAMRAVQEAARKRGDPELAAFLEAAVTQAASR